MCVVLASGRALPKPPPRGMTRMAIEDRPGGDLNGLLASLLRDGDGTPSSPSGLARLLAQHANPLVRPRYRCRRPRRMGRVRQPLDQIHFTDYLQPGAGHPRTPQEQAVVIDEPGRR